MKYNDRTDLDRFSCAEVTVGMYRDTHGKLPPLQKLMTPKIDGRWQAELVGAFPLCS